MALVEPLIDNLITVIIVAASVAVLLCVVLILKYVGVFDYFKRKFSSGNGGQVSADDVLEEMAMVDNKYVLERNVIYSFGKDGQLLDGSYTFSCGCESTLVHYNTDDVTFANGQTVTFADGDTLCALETDVYLEQTL